MNNKIARATSRLNSRLAHRSPVQIWLIGALDAVITLLVIAVILASIYVGSK